jgi:hypothetical protein
VSRPCSCSGDGIAAGQVWESVYPARVRRVIRITSVTGSDVTYEKISGTGGPSRRIRKVSLMAQYRPAPGAVPDPVKLTPSLAVEYGQRPPGAGSPDGAVVMIRKRHGGQVTLSLKDWNALKRWIRTGEAP